MAGKKFTLAVLILLVAVSAAAQSPFGGGGPPPVCAPSEGGNPMCQVSLSWPPLKPLSPGGPPGGEVQDLPPASGAGTGGMPVVDENLFFGGGSTGGHGAGGSWGFTTTYGNGWSAINTSSYGEGGWTGGVGYQGSTATSDLNNARNAWEKFGGIAALTGPVFGKYDLLMGVANGTLKDGIFHFDLLERFRAAGGGKGIILGRPPEGLPLKQWIASEAINMHAGAKLRFNLDYMVTDWALDQAAANAAGVEGTQAYMGVTAYELRFLRAGYGTFFSKANLGFYRGMESLGGLFEVLKPW